MITNEPSQIDAPAVGPPERTSFVARHRTPISVVVHGVLFAVALLMAFGIAYNFHNVFPREAYSGELGLIRVGGWFLYMYLPLLVLALPLKLLAFALFHQFRHSWRFVGLRDLIGVVSASYVGSFMFMVAYFGILAVRPSFMDSLIGQAGPGIGFRQGAVFLSDLVATIGLVSVMRVLWRFYHEEFKKLPDGQRRRMLIIGAGRVGESILREIIASGEGHEVVGFLDDDPTRLHNRIHSVEVLGPTSEVRDIAEREDVQEILIALPGASPKEIRGIVESCQGESITFRTIPSVSDLIEGRVEVSQMRSVSIEDLLGRDPIQLDTDAIGSVLKGKRIAITGAGGSIGAEMCRQIARFEPQKLFLIEQAENNLFEIDRELRATFPKLDITPYVADILDVSRIERVLTEAKPSAVFHAAAHKHVPMMESNPGEAIKNNVQGTRIVADCAVAVGVEKMVMISTDKAVNPTSIMGCSKRVAELYVQQLSQRSKTQFVTVRFGNVLGSSGSVVPIFQRQIAEGGPVTVTHPDMKRYFMTIPEASQLVLQAGAMGQGGEIYVLDMGEPVKILDLARDMIQLSGLRPDIDIEIEFSGVRPGEKLFEELAIAGEDVSATNHPKIGIWRHRPEDWNRLCAAMDELVAVADSATHVEIVERLLGLVPEFQTNGDVPTSTATAATRAAAT